MSAVYLLVEESWFRGEISRDNLAVYQSLQDAEKEKVALEATKDQKDRFWIERIEFIREEK